MKISRWLEHLSALLSKRDVSDTLDLLRLQLKDTCSVRDTMDGLRRHKN